MRGFGLAILLRVRRRSGFPPTESSTRFLIRAGVTPNRRATSRISWAWFTSLCPRARFCLMPSSTNLTDSTTSGRRGTRFRPSGFRSFDPGGRPSPGIPSHSPKVDNSFLARLPSWSPAQPGELTGMACKISRRVRSRSWRPHAMLPMGSYVLKTSAKSLEPTAPPLRAGNVVRRAPRLAKSAIGIVLNPRTRRSLRGGFP